MKKATLGLLIGVFIFSMAGFALAQAAPAASDAGINIGVAPVRVEIQDIKPGDSSTEIIRIKNNSDKKIDMKAIAQDFIAKDEQGNPEIVAESDPRVNQRISASRWMNFEKPDFYVNPGATFEEKITIKVPADATPGLHTASVLFQPVVSPSEKMMVTGQIAALVLVNVAGKVVEEGSITKFETGIYAEQKIQDATQKVFTSKSSLGSFPMAFNITFKNTGTTFYAPHGTITISRFGKQVDLINIKPENVLPDTPRQLITEWAGKGGFGKYTAHTKLTFGKAAKTAEADVTFWVVPVLPLILIIIVIIALILLVWFFGIYYPKKLKSKIIAEHNNINR